MKFVVKGLTIVNSAEIEIAPLTIICGKNNTGKTQVTNTIYKFCQQFYNQVEIPISDDKKSFPVQLDLKDYSAIIIEQFRNFVRNFQQEENIKEFSVDISENDFVLDKVVAPFSIRASSSVFRIVKTGTILDISLLGDSNSELFPLTPEAVKHIISQLVKYYFFTKLVENNICFNKSFSVMSERTGLVYFKKHINIANALVASGLQDTLLLRSNPLLENNRIERENLNIDLSIFKALTFFESLGDESKIVISSFNKQFISDLVELTGGNYRYKKGKFYFSPTDASNTSLTSNLFSSSVKSLLLLDYYIRYLVEPNCLLVIDEPELNLHPEKQRQLARLLAKLVNAGVYVLITTHSDYIIREFSILLALNQKEERFKLLQKTTNYSEECLLDAEQVKAYEAQSDNANGVVFKEMEISPTEGIAADTLYDVIDQLNNLQEEIVWGE